MQQLSPEDKINIATFLESSTVNLAKLQNSLPFISDDGLKKLNEAAIATAQAQIKGAQEFCKSHGLS